MNAWSTAVDASIGTYAILAFLAYLIWKTPGLSSRRWFAVFSLCAAFTFSIKYTGVVMVLAFGALLIVDRPGGYGLPLLRRLCGYGLLTLLVMSPWFVRNTLRTGNPVYPILWKIFPSRDMNVRQIETEEGSAQQNVPHTIGEFLGFPWRQTMREISNFNFIGPMTLAALPLLLFIPWRKVREQSALFWLGGFYFLIALRFSGEIRYLLPGFFLLSLALSAGIDAIAQRRRWIGWITQACFAMLAIYQMVWIVQCAQGLYKPGPVLTGQTSQITYVSTMHDGLNLCPWNTMEEDLAKLPESSRIYILGNEQVFRFPRRFDYSTCHDYTPLVLWANAATSADALFAKMNEMQLTHILINAPEAVRLAHGYGPLAWTDQGRRVFTEFAQKYLQLVDVKPIDKFPQALFLYEIKANPSVSAVSFQEFFKGILNL
jgi:hypothetical protein